MRRVFIILCLVSTLLACSNKNNLIGCDGVGNMLSVHSYKCGSVIKTKWGDGFVDSCEFCGFEKLNIPYCYSVKSNIGSVIAIKSPFSDSFDEYYVEWHDPNKPEPQYIDIKECDIRKLPMSTIKKK